MIKVVYNGKDFKKVEADVKKAFDFVDKFFLIKTGKIIVRVYHNRLDFNKFLNRKTEIWLVANASNNNEIDILSPLAMKHESSHSENEFLAILKHEFTHIFINNLAKGAGVPLWLNEGLAAYVAKQHQKNTESFRCENGFSQKLDKPREWDKNIDSGAYPISALFVSFLIKKYSLVKIKQLISSLDKHYSYNKFEKVFLRVYQISFKEVENEFIIKVNK